jgi:hypothetical protein
MGGKTRIAKAMAIEEALNEFDGVSNEYNHWI